MLTEEEREREDSWKTDLDTMDIPDGLFDLIDASCELDTLEDQLQLIERHLNDLQESEGAKLAERLRQFKPDDPESYELEQDFYHRHEHIYPRFFWGAFLILLYAVYEAAVTETAKLIRERSGVETTLEDWGKRDFLDRAKKHFKRDLDFVLCRNNCDWEQIKMLSAIRNAYAHANGRTAMLNDSVISRLKNWSKKGAGIVVGADYITVDIHFVRKSFKCVQSSLADLIVRYKQWMT